MSLRGIGGEGKAADWHRAGEFREQPGGSGRDTECNPGAGASQPFRNGLVRSRLLRVPEGAEGRGRAQGVESTA